MYMVEWYHHRCLAYMHNHLDNTYYVGKWKVCTPFVGRVKEEDMIPCLLLIGKERAKKILELFLQNGVNHTGSVSGRPYKWVGKHGIVFRVIKIILYAYELVAFPQHGLL